MPPVTTDTPATATEAGGHVATICRDIRALGASGLPGDIAVFGPESFPAFVAANGVTVVAGATLGAGRVIAFSHEGYLTLEAQPVPTCAGDVLR